MKSYESYLNKDNRSFLLSQPYINEYTSDKNKGKLNIPLIAVSSFNFLPNLYKFYKAPLSYASLIRFFIFTWFFKYNGNNKLLLSVKEDLKSNNKKSENLRIIGQFANNNKILNSLNLPKHINARSEDLDVIAYIVRNKDYIFTEENIIFWFNMVKRITKISDKSENEIINLINNNNNIFLNNAIPASDQQDVVGIDIIAYTSKGEKKYIQVKKIGKESSFKHEWKDESIFDEDGNKTERLKYVFSIFNTDLDLKDYNKFNDNLIYDYLFLYYTKEKTVISINTKAILSIVVKNQNIFINCSVDNTWFSRMIKFYKL